MLAWSLPAQMLAPNCDVVDLTLVVLRQNKICAGAALMGEPDNLVAMMG